jgi:hypothetical protein
MSILLYLKAIWYIFCRLVFFSRFGILYNEKIWQTCVNWENEGNTMKINFLCISFVAYSFMHWLDIDQLLR